MEMHTIRSGANAFCRAALVLWFGLTTVTACGSANQSGASAPMTATAPNATSEPGATTATAGAPLKVITTFSVLGDLVGNVAGDLVELKTLVPPGADAHTRIVTHIFADRDAESLKRLALSIIARPGHIALLGSRDAGERPSARLVFARAADTSGDLNTLLREACVLLDGRGGGRPDLAQGGGTNAENLPRALQTALSRLISTS